MAAASYNSENSSVTLQKKVLDETSLRISELRAAPHPELDEETVVEEKLSFFDRVKRFGAIEAYLFLTTFGAGMRSLVEAKLTLVKTCVLAVDLHIKNCTALEEDSSEYKVFDNRAKEYLAVFSWVSALTMVVMGSLIGSFCNKYQRKVPLMLAAFGTAIESAMMIYSAEDMDSPLLILAASKFPASFFGGSMVALSGTYAYVTEMASVKSRQIRFAILQMLVFAGFTFGMFASGYLFQDKNYAAVFGGSVAASLLSMLLIGLFMEEKNQKTKEMTYGEIIRAFFSIDFLKDSYRLVAAPREGNKRLQLWLLVTTAFILGLSANGTRNLTFLYAKKRYLWTVERLSYVTGALIIGTAFATVAGVRVFTKILKLRDSTIALIGFSSLAIDYLLRGLAESGTVFVMAYVVGALGGCATSANDKCLTGLLKPDEIGKVLVLKTLVEILSPAVGTSLFAKLSGAFEDTVPGVMFLSAAILIIFPTLIVAWVSLYGTAPMEKRDRETSNTTVNLEEVRHVQYGVTVEERVRSISFIHL